MSEPTTTLPSTSGATPSQQQPVPRKSDFIAAEEIKGILHDRQKAEQERIMRWVNESLGLKCDTDRSWWPQPISPSVALNNTFHTLRRARPFASHKHTSEGYKDVRG